MPQQIQLPHGNAVHAELCSALLRLGFYEVYLVAPFELQQQIRILELG